MRVTARAPVTWPSERGFALWWQGVVSDLLGEDSSIPGLFASDGEHVRLETGEHLRPGAVYRWVPPAGDVRGALGWGIGGAPERREVYLEYQEHADPERRVAARVDGLDHCAGLSATSTLDHLEARCALAPARDGLLDLEVRLDWLVVQIRAQVLPDSASEQLQVDVTVDGRGLWRPIMAPFLVPVGVYLREVVTEETTEVAERLTHLDSDPRGNGAPERDLALIREGAELIRGRLHEAVRAVQARPFWKRRDAAAVREAHGALTEVGSGWPAVHPVITFGASGRWWDEEIWLLEAALERDHRPRDRARLVDEQVDAWLAAQEEVTAHEIKVAAWDRRRTRLSIDLGAVASAAEFNEWLDLSWLASPWSAIRFLVRKTREGDPEADLPKVDSDEDARALLRHVLQDL